LSHSSSFFSQFYFFGPFFYIHLSFFLSFSFPLFRSFCDQGKGIIPNTTLHYLAITSRSVVLLQELAITRLDKKLPAFYATRRVTGVSTWVRHWPLSQARRI
jgi:hypothetical protein